MLDDKIIEGAMNFYVRQGLAEGEEPNWHSPKRDSMKLISISETPANHPDRWTGHYLITISYEQAGSDYDAEQGYTPNGKIDKGAALIGYVPDGEHAGYWLWMD